MKLKKRNTLEHLKELKEEITAIAHQSNKDEMDYTEAINRAIQEMLLCIASEKRDRQQIAEIR